MRTFLLLTIMAALSVCSGCSDDDSIYLHAATDTLAFEGTACETQRIEIDANIEWSLSEPRNAWLHVAKSEDGASVLVSVDENPTPKERESGFVIESQEGSSIAVRVLQRGNSTLDIYRIAEAGYLQDFYGNGLSAFEMHIFNCEFDQNNVAVSDGYIIQLDFFSEKPTDEVHPDIASGHYTVSDEGGIFTAVPGRLAFEDNPNLYIESCVHILDDRGAVTVSHGIMESSSFDIERNGALYMITVDLLLTDGTRIKGYYEGEMWVGNPFLSTLVEDTELSPLGRAYCTFIGDWRGDYNNNWIYFLTSDSIGIDSDGNFYGSGDILRYELFSRDDWDITPRPAGSFTIDDTRDRQTIYAGTTNPDPFSTEGYYLGAWYFRLEDGQIADRAPLVSGTVQIDKFQADSGWHYRISVDALEDQGYAVKGSYEGPLADLAATAAASIPRHCFRSRAYELR